MVMTSLMTDFKMKNAARAKMKLALCTGVSRKNIRRTTQLFYCHVHGYKTRTNVDINVNKCYCYSIDFRAIQIGIFL